MRIMVSLKCVLLQSQKREPKFQAAFVICLFMQVVRAYGVDRINKGSRKLYHVFLGVELNVKFSGKFDTLDDYLK